MPRYGKTTRDKAKALEAALRPGRKSRGGRPKVIDTSLPVILAIDGSPLDYMLAVLRDPTAAKERRDRMAIAAAPFCHKRYMEPVVQERKTLKKKRAEDAEKVGTKGRWSGLLDD